MKQILELPRVKALVAAFCLLVAGASWGTAAFTDLGAGARATGLGNAFVAIADDVYSVYYNPAGLPLLTQPELATAYTKHMVGLSDGSNLSTSFVGYAQPLKGGLLGTTALSWQQFSLNGGLYRDQAIYFSYGNKMLKDFGPGNLYAGANVKILNRSFGNTPEAANAIDDAMNATGQADPLLSGKRSINVLDLDLGFLYRMYDKYSAGLSLGHLTRPNVAFAANDSDKLPLSIKVGINRRNLLSNVGVQYETRQSPTAVRDQRLTIALERWFPWLLVGNVGARAALTLGNRDFNQISAGASYKNRQISVDYSFSLPLNSVAPAAGSHRVSFSMRFGASPEPEESVITLLAAMRKLKSGAIQESAAQEVSISPDQKEQSDRYISRAKALEAEAQYREALAQYGKAVELTPADAVLVKTFTRLNLIAAMVKALPDYKTDQAQMAWHQGILAYVSGDDIKAVERVSKAFSLQPEAANLGPFLSQLEFITGLRRVSEPGAPGPEITVAQLLAKAEAAVEQKDYKSAIELSAEVIKQDPNNLSAWETLGLSYFAVNDYGNWLVTWEKTYELQTDPARWAQLNLRLKELKGNTSQQPEAAEDAALPAQNIEADSNSAAEVQAMLAQAGAAIKAGNYQAAVELSKKVIEKEPENLSAWENIGISYFAIGDYQKWVEAWEKTHSLEKNPERWEELNKYLNTLRRNFTPQQQAVAAEAAAAQPVIMRPAAERQAPAVRKEDLQGLYNMGIDFYTSGRLDKAKATFEKILQLDPNNGPAVKALNRVKEDLQE